MSMSLVAFLCLYCSNISNTVLSVNHKYNHDVHNGHTIRAIVVIKKDSATTEKTYFDKENNYKKDESNHYDSKILSHCMNVYEH